MTAEAVPDQDVELPADRFSDRELSWLAFNKRVLDLASDSARVPLLERARFAAIFASRNAGTSRSFMRATAPISSCA